MPAQDIQALCHVTTVLTFLAHAFGVLVGGLRFGRGGHREGEDFRRLLRSVLSEGTGHDFQGVHVGV